MSDNIFSNLLGAGAFGLNLGQGIGNFIQQRDVMNWQKRMQEEAWVREDSAVTRRALDLQNAGLSKTLAAGSAASSSAPIKLSAPQMASNPVASALEAKNAFMNSLLMKENITKTKEETKNVELQNARQAIENEYVDEMSQEKLTQLKLANTLSESTIPLTIENMMANISNKNQDTELKKAQEQLTKLKQNTEVYNASLTASQALIEGYKAYINKDGQMPYMNEVYLSLIQKNVQLKIANVLGEMNYHDRFRTISWFTSLGLPTDMSLNNTYGDLVKVISGMITGDNYDYFNNLVKDFSITNEGVNKYNKLRRNYND